MPAEVTRLLNGIQNGDPRSSEALLPLVYDELRRLAASRMAREKPGQTLQPTALVHEAWVRLAGSDQAAWDNRAHFFGAAAEAMRRILIDKARRRQRVRHGAGLERVDADAIELPAPIRDDQLVALDEALTELEKTEPQKAQVVKLRYFIGLTNRETADSLGLSVPTVERYWAFAKTWLYTRIEASRRD